MSRAFLLIVALLLTPACDAPESATSQSPADTRTTTTSTTPSETVAAGLGDRIAVIGGPVTEIAFALGAGDRIAVVDASSIYPPQAAKLPQVDYFRKVSAEPVLANSPSSALIIEGAGPETAIEQIDAAVDVTRISGADDVASAIERIETLGELLDAPERAAELVTKLKADLDEVSKRRDGSTSSPRVLFIYARGPNTLLVAGEDTAAAKMLALAGAENAGAGFEGFKPMTAEAVVAAAPDVLLMPDKGAQSIGGWDGLAKLPGVAQTPANKDKRLVTIDDAALLGFGPRMGQALLQLQDALEIR